MSDRPTLTVTTLKQKLLEIIEILDTLPPERELNLQIDEVSILIDRSL